MSLWFGRFGQSLPTLVKYEERKKDVFEAGKVDDLKLMTEKDGG